MVLAVWVASRVAVWVGPVEKEVSGVLVVLGVELFLSSDLSCPSVSYFFSRSDRITLGRGRRPPLSLNAHS